MAKNIHKKQIKQMQKQQYRIREIQRNTEKYRALQILQIAGAILHLIFLRDILYFFLLLVPDFQISFTALQFF